MSFHAKPAYRLIPAIGLLSGFANFIGFLPHLFFLSLLLITGKSASLKFLIPTYIASLVLVEYFFWSLWKKRISNELKTDNWKSKILAYENHLIAVICSISEVIVEIFLIRVVLDIGCEPIWVFFTLICAKAVGAPIQLTLCDMTKRKPIFLFSLLTNMLIILFMYNFSTTSLAFIVLVIKGLMGNTWPIARTIIADHQDIYAN